ncbi:NAD(P)/FAD-dependent oxidoreductase [Vibrio sp. SCSIO 43137]|uniref:NAD(P)/FAD-dependent oxidoreductase n=1 Tax=Vibrio sp. SCSIO 43137 TaxID=3021011 RepID=UPI0023072BCD|nr:NAD(P)/FAD-dependent oxidoreductase [Vibrio sp. SCSIO 43137]WCE29671.1 NAD(P)/FAD-dependent oxidoreductase [Vibrio sp. SCSIO 43137]
MKKVDVVIVGAGAAGLMCAQQAGKRGRSVLVLDHAKKPGRKILISGGGKCNFTNYDVTATNYLCSNPHFVKSALSQYTNWDFISLVSKYGIEFEERDHGQLFCVDSAKQIVDMMLSECNLPSVEFEYRVDISCIEKRADGYIVTFDNVQVESESLVIATGGVSMPKLGASPFGYKVAEQFGLNVVATSAGLVPFTLHKSDKDVISELSGIAVDAEITTQSGVSFSEALLFTHRGLSGPAVLQASSYWKPGEEISINLVPASDIEGLLANSLQKHPNQSLKNTLAKVLPKRLIEALIKLQLLQDKPLKQFNPRELDDIATGLQQWKVVPNATEGYRTAEVTLGGVDTNHISSKTMEVKNIKGLFFIGEVLDVAGHLGGYNFQFCWSSGFVAGNNV